MNMNDDDNIYLMHDKVVLNLKVLLEIMFLKSFEIIFNKMQTINLYFEFFVFQ